MPQLELATGVKARVDMYLEAQGLSAQVDDVVALTGDASDRRYVRVGLVNGESLVLAVHSGPIEFAALPFARVAALLRQVPLPIPEIIGHSDSLGIVALQDLGDVTLQAHLGHATPEERRRRYRVAVELIERLQRRGKELASEQSLPYQISFDLEKLTWELRFFVKHFLEAFRGTVITDTLRAALDEEWLRIAGELAAEPKVVCHRDYHSRNLMVYGDELFVIDFQDARLGPDTYDLASLLRDSYVDLPEPLVDELIAYFLEVKGIRDAETFRRRFDAMALQRNLKALGTFGFQATARENPVYVQHVPRTLGYLRANLHRDRRSERLLELLSTPLAELR